MWKEEVIGNLVGEIVNWQALLRDVEARNLTGFIKIETWEYTDYVIVGEGNPLKVVRVEGKNKSFLPLAQYRPPEDSKISVFKSTPILTAHICKSGNFEELQTLIISGYGNEVFHSNLNIIDSSNFKKFVEKVDFSGYTVCYTFVDILCNIFFLNGKIIGLNVKKHWDKNALDLLDMSLGEVFISSYVIEPEEIILLNSLKNGLEKKKDFREGYGFVYGGDIISFVFKGETRKTLKLEIEEIREENSKTGSTFYGVKVIENPEEIPIGIDEILGTKGQRVSEKTIQTVKNIFLEHIGPIGKVVWDRIIKDLQIPYDRFTTSTLKLLVIKLKEEIPEEDLQSEFLKRIKEVIDEFDT
ncbi:MAG: hypothetical protein DSY42_02300 [Aquifex sp.]|nr:MAG: hypothetical protein DSY42_02300 [Aquifex sp.]